MKIVAYVFAVALSVAVMFAGTVALVLTGHLRAQPATLLLGVVSLVAMIYGPLLLGSLLAFWDVNRSAKSRAFYRRWVIRVTIAQAVGAVAIIVDAAIGGTAWWVAGAFILTGILLTVLALGIGNAVRRREERRPPQTAEIWQPISPDEVRRKIRIIVRTFVIALVLSIVGNVVLFFTLDRTGRHPGTVFSTLSLAIELPLFAAAFACILVALPLGRRLRETSEGDLGRMRTFARVVLRGKSEELLAEEEQGAARYAAGITLFLRFQLAYLVLLYAGVMLQQVTSLLGGSMGAGFPIGLILAMLLVLVIALPLYARRMRRARLYAENHRDLLTA